MSTNKFGQIIQSIGELFQKIIQFVYSAATRAFSPNDDDYPASGVQPYEGDPPAKGKHY
ncbi:hypothetical protein H6G41_07265 [Tolypothrix sp. FACHB-123]|uniref:hypothetical protein n=1 Tax=Tolypothrix sp. FACHB-123 TaxID=2692868 RepID=UPI001685C26A|nr:hypothetical protein [Tolypothrix sp. FACHB-123]MBD2354426.1 hypothetical protein [Tolypothrix sp. FACHB-123]